MPFRVIRAAAPHLREPAKERDEGREVFRKIVNVSSISGTMGNAGQANYSAGKNAVVGLTKTLAKEWGQFKINVNAVAFGFIETRLTASKDESNTMEIGGEKVQLGIPEQMRGMASMLIPLGRPGTPEEAAGGVFFLCSPWSNFVHGQVLNITGGQFGGDDDVTLDLRRRRGGPRGAAAAGARLRGLLRGLAGRREAAVAVARADRGPRSRGNPAHRARQRRARDRVRDRVWLWSTLGASRVGLMNDLFVAPEVRGSGAARGADRALPRAPASSAAPRG